ncbi:GD16694 [Drosophila simulans]|uniref:GD16694 n=1 Tax=Drosophila simulans TaxID=7240 RepID=B4R4I5_DROSI|nr:GD16694 [Drosophila simulans]
MRSFLQMFSQKPILSSLCGKTLVVWPGNPTNVPESDFIQQMLQECRQMEKPDASVDLNNFKAISEQSPAKFIIDSCRVKAQPEDRGPNIQKQIASAYPVIHERTLLLFISFLEHKLKFGSEQEKALYKDMTVIDLVQRLLAKRCVWFFGAGDYYCTMQGKIGHGGFEAVGTPAETDPLTLTSVLSYDEIKLAALLYVSCHSEFINNGSRANAGAVTQNKDTIEREGVVIGLIGARFERSDVMEYQDIMITKTQNTQAKGYGFDLDKMSSETPTPASDLRRIWREFYEEPKDFIYADTPYNPLRFEKVPEGFFDHQVMRKRYAISFDTLLLEAQDRAFKAGKPAYIHVVGIGLGVWKAASEQERTFLECFEGRLRFLGERLSHIGVVHFSWFHLRRVGSIYEGAILPVDRHPQGCIRIRNSVRNPGDKLTEDMLPVVTYAWDGNALPGNEFWDNVLVGTGDPAAACSTLISELQNPHINVHYMNGANLHIASVEHGLLHVGDYARRLID